MPVHKLRSPLILESGDTLFNPQVYYRKFGEFNRSKDNVILFWLEKERDKRDGEVRN
jgi:homoserine acetyltransferase